MDWGERKEEVVKEGKVPHRKARKNFLMDTDPGGKLMNAVYGGGHS